MAKATLELMPALTMKSEGTSGLSEINVVALPRPVMDGVSLQVHEGEIYGLIGPDGAGKSSLLKVIAGVLAQDAGELRVFDCLIDSEKSSEIVKDRIGLMPQGLGQNLYGDLSVEENIDYFGGLRLLSREELSS